MSLHCRAAGLSLAGFFIAISISWAQEPKKADPADNDKEVVNSKPVKRLSAACVNFRKELGLPFPTLNTLGARIAAARRASDPVAMANAAAELGAAEKISGKKASLTAHALIKEATDMASLRKSPEEAQSVLLAAQQVTEEKETIARINREIAACKTQQAALAEAAKKEMEPKWIGRKVLLNNFTTQYIDVFVNGRWAIQVAPGEKRTYIVEHRWDPLVLTGTGDEDVDSWGPRIIWGKFDKYTWNMYGDYNYPDK